MQPRLTTKPVDEVISAIQALDLESVKLRVMDAELGEGWTREYANSVEAAYKQYLSMQVKYPDDAEDILLSKDVDEFWHTHILQTIKYSDDCQTMFGNFLHHNPHIGKVSPAVQEKRNWQAEKTRRLYEREFGSTEHAAAAWTGVADALGIPALSNSEIRADNGALSNSEIRAGNAALSNSEIRAGSAALSNSEIRAGSAALSNSEIRAGNAALSNSEIRAGNAALSNSEIRAGNAALSNSEIRASNAALSNSEIRAGSAALSNSEIRAGNAALSNSEIRVGNAALSNSEIRAGNAALSNSEIRMDVAAVIWGSQPSRSDGAARV